LEKKGKDLEGGKGLEGENLEGLPKEGLALEKRDWEIKFYILK